MIRAELLLTDLEEVATLDRGPVPRTGARMRELGRIPDAAIGMDAGRVVYVGPSRGVGRRVSLRRGGQRRSLRGHVIVPGFVDAHTHLLFAGERSSEVSQKIDGKSYLDIARSGGGLFSTVRATRRAASSDLLTQALGRLHRMQSYGTTTAEVKSGYALTHAGEIRLLSLIPQLERRSRLRLVPTFLGAHARPPEFAHRPEEYVRAMVQRTIPEVARRGLARFADVFCEPGFFSASQSERILREAGANGLGAKIHADEFVPSGGARLASRLGARSADHLLATPPADFDGLAKAGVTAVLLPVTPFASLSKHASPGRPLIDAGVAVALGSDLCPNSWVESMPTVMAHAVYSARLTPAEALTAATINAAHAIGEEEHAGRISAGREADLAVFELPSVEHIAYRMGVVPVEVYRQGIRISPR
ncbi:MAG: imidazolonepropionase [Thermoplasmata archaeon]